MRTGARPLLVGKSEDEVMAFIKEQLSKRNPFYTKAKHTLDVSLLDTYDKIAGTVTQVRKLVGL